MPLPPAWKVQRELLRIKHKVLPSVARVTYEPYRKVVYDLTASGQQQVTDGALPLTDRVAVFVVFQPKGVAASIFLTLDHLKENGFSVLVVSNGTLSSKDRAALARNAAVVLERPNVGYDFGGYRDGIRHLWSRNQDMSRLVLLNDSSWFPLRRDDDSLARMEQLGADVAGHIYKIEDENARNQDHVESHLLMFSPEFLNSPEFKRFWSDYRMSDYRTTTIEVGEKGLSQMAIRCGRTVATLMDRDWFLDTLRGMDEPKLREVLNHTIDGFPGRQKDASAIRSSARKNAPWRDDYLAWIDGALSNSRTFMISATFVMPALVYGGMGFAKKATDIRFHLARMKLLELEASGKIPPIDHVVRAEIARSVERWVPPKAPWSTSPPEQVRQQAPARKETAAAAAR
ncbi:rhamnan synthesis F family protein [Tabrizicola sp.]|uniref:rhamnan synthesis F family protein n=1 Tax=Tabrizicola sp. TaxID=2005166 RepID=UPI003F397BE9